MVTQAYSKSAFPFWFIVAGGTLLLMVLAGCDRSSDEPLANNEAASPVAHAPGEQVAFKYGTPDKYKWGNLSGEEAERVRKQDMRMMEAHVEAFHEIRDEVSSDKLSLAEKRQVAKELLAKHEGEPMTYLLEQTIGVRLIAQVLGDGSVKSVMKGREAASKKALSEEEQQTVGFATQLLVQNDNPNADLIARSLEVLEGHWSEAQIQAAARQSAQAASSWIKEECANCGQGSEALQVTRERRSNRVQQGLTKLRVMEQ